MPTTIETRSLAPRTQSRARRHAFTLIELTMVLVLVGVIAAVAMPRYANSLARYRAEQAAKRLQADLILARQLAVRGSRAVRIGFVTGSTSNYYLAGVPDPDRPASIYTVNLFDEPYAATFGTVTVGGDDRLIFDGFGIPDSTAAIMLIVGSERRRVVVDASGEVGIETP